MCYGACKGGRLMRLLSGVVYGLFVMKRGEVPLTAP
jgi:hypothetical protein